ncbi:MAG: hypothetical protein HN849_19960, partial [Victivallales bacterium]|nr:hypothetical protein [Victivallales bacterium]
MQKKRTTQFMALGALLALASGCHSLSSQIYSDVQVAAFPLPDYRGVHTFSFEGGSIE